MSQSLSLPRLAAAPRPAAPAPKPAPRPAVRLVVFDTGSSPASARENLRAIAEGKAEDRRPATEKPVGCSHPGCKVHQLLEVGWVSQSDLAKAGGDPAMTPVRCFKHRAEGDLPVPKAVLAHRRAKTKREEEARRQAEADRRRNDCLWQAELERLGRR